MPVRSSRDQKSDVRGQSGRPDCLRKFDLYLVLSTEYSVPRTKDMTSFHTKYPLPLALGVVITIAVFAGCGAPVAEFRRYETFAHKVAETNGLEKGFTRDQLQGLDETMQ